MTRCTETIELQCQLDEHDSTVEHEVTFAAPAQLDRLASDLIGRAEEAHYAALLLSQRTARAGRMWLFALIVAVFNLCLAGLWIWRLSVPS